MKCKIADLIVEIPLTGGMSSRCVDYIRDTKESADITIEDQYYNYAKWTFLNKESVAYMESGFQFYRKLLFFNGMMLHSSSIEMEGKAYLFSGPSTVGKSTHAKLWQQLFGENVQVFNDDKPAIRKIEGKWYAYGTPWCGKDGINKNMKVPLAGICFLRQGTENSIRKLISTEAVGLIISQTMKRFKEINHLDLMLNLVDQLVREIPIYELTNRPEPEAARLSYETMRRGAEEAGL